MAMKIDFENEYETISMSWEEEAEDIYEEIRRFKRYLLAAGYNNILTDRLVYLDDAQFAKYKLVE
jgi:hypothetical protein